MKIYVGHSTAFNYIEELYKPLMQSPLWKNNKFFLPHDKSQEVINTRDIIINSDIFIAEVSYPSTGLGIELGWASTEKTKIVCIGREGAKLSSSLNVINADFIQFVDQNDMIQKISRWLEEYAHTQA